MVLVDYFSLSRMKNNYFMFLNFGLKLLAKVRFHSFLCSETTRSPIGQIENILGDSLILLKYFY
jgi:hypothetical protein